MALKSVNNRMEDIHEGQRRANIRRMIPRAQKAGFGGSYAIIGRV
jgi:hypothetical protein